MDAEDGFKVKIATSSPEEGLDFACNLIATAVSKDADSHPERACELLRTLAQYVQFRYVGELELAAEYITDLGRMISPVTSFEREQFWRQMQWVAQAIGLPVRDYTEEKR